MTVITADSSVVVPAIAEWHARHSLARAETGAVDRLPAHALAEAFSVLTRLPHGLALTPMDAAAALLGAFPEPALILDATGHRELIERAGAAEVRGGQVHDALIGATATAAGALLLTLDRRAIQTYERMGVRYRALDA